jgi:tRNA nucleotidyltransferase (CCA-adding enzyme)
LHLTPNLWQQLRRVERWLQHFQLADIEPLWQLLLQVLITQLDTCDRISVAQRLQLSESIIQRLQKLPDLEQHLLQTFPSSPQSPKASQIYQALQDQDVSTLVLVGTRHPHTLGPYLWRYITQLSQVTPWLNGHDLKQLGYRPGPLFKTMLASVLHAQLDGILSSREAAMQYLQANFAEPDKIRPSALVPPS